MRRLRQIIVLFLIFFCGEQLIAENDADEFKSIFFQISILKTFPQPGPRNNFSTTKPSMNLGIAHKVAGQPWIVGAALGYKNLKESRTKERIYLFNYVQESLYVLRVTHPVYLLFGPQLIYIAPSFGVKFPPKNNPSYRKQFGAGMAAKVAILAADASHFITLGMDHWRGVENREFYASSFALGVFFAL